MDIVLAVNEEHIENYVQSLSDISVLKVIHNNRTLYTDVLKMKPQLVLVSNRLAGRKRIEDILQSIRKERPQTRIAYIYGQDDVLRKPFYRFLTSIGIYDFHFCDKDASGNPVALTDKDINELINNPKMPGSIPDTITKEDDNNSDKIESPKTELVYRKEKEEERKRVREEITRQYAKRINDALAAQKSNNLTQSAAKDNVTDDNSTNVTEKMPEEIPEDIEDEIEQKVIAATEKELVVQIQLIERVEEKDVVRVEKETVIETKFVKKQTIAVLSVYSTKLKDYFVSNFAHVLAKKTNQKILLIDLESPFPTLDHRFNTSINIDIAELYNAEELTGVSGCLSAIKKGILNNNTFIQYPKKIKGYSNLYLLTGLNSIDKFDSAAKEDINYIIDCAEQTFDTVILSLNNFIENEFTFCGLIKANRIIFVTEADYTDARAELSYMKEYVDYFQLNKNIINILPFATLTDNDTLNQLYKGYNILHGIRDNPRYKKMAYKKELLLTGAGTKEDMRCYIKVLNSFGFVPKESLIKRLHAALNGLKNT